MKCAKRTGFCVQKCQIKPQKVAKNSPFLRFCTGICEWKGAGKWASTRGATRASNSEPRFLAALFSRQLRRFDSDCCHCGLPTANCPVPTFCLPRQRDSHLKHRTLSRLLRALTVPPSASAIHFPIDNPKPAPPVWRERPWSARKKRPKVWGRSSAATPFGKSGGVAALHLPSPFAILGIAILGYCFRCPGGVVFAQR